MREQKQANARREGAPTRVVATTRVREKKHEQAIGGSGGGGGHALGIRRGGEGGVHRASFAMLLLRTARPSSRREADGATHGATHGARRRARDTYLEAAAIIRPFYDRSTTVIRRRTSKRWPPYGKGDVRLRSSAGTSSGGAAATAATLTDSTAV